MDFFKTMKISAAGMHAQSSRLRVVAENLANADSTADTPGGKPYQRKTVTFSNELDREMGVPVVKVDRYGVDPTPFEKRYDPGHPGADESGYVELPNVNPMIEMMDMREAQRSYEANLNVIEISKSMLQRTIEILR